MRLLLSILAAGSIHLVFFLSSNTKPLLPQIELGKTSQKTSLQIRASFNTPPKAEARKKEEPKKEVKKIKELKKKPKKIIKPKKKVLQKVVKEVKKVEKKKEAKQKVNSQSSSYSTNPIPRKAVNADYLNNPPPKYPLLALRRNQQGTAILEVKVNKKGQVKEISLKKSSGYSILDNSAIKSVKSWRFIPAKYVNGEPAEAIVIVPIEYRLR